MIVQSLPKIIVMDNMVFHATPPTMSSPLLITNSATTQRKFPNSKIFFYFNPIIHYTTLLPFHQEFLKDIQFFHPKFISDSSNLIMDRDHGMNFI